MPKDNNPIPQGFRQEYVSPKFGGMLQEYLKGNPRTSEAIKKRDFEGLARIVLENPNIPLTSNTIAYELRFILGGNVIGAKGYLTINSNLKIRDYVIRCFHIMHSFRVPSNSRMIQLLKKETGVTDVFYPPKEEFPYGVKRK